MTRVRTFGLCAIASVALFLAVATSASAEPPEFGRCVKVAIGTGAFATGNCTSEGGEKKFEWMAGPPSNPQFSIGASAKGDSVAFEGTVSKAKIVCEFSTGAGEILSPSTIGNLTLTLTGCETAGFPCASNAEASGSDGPPELHKIEWGGLSGELGVVKAAEPPLKDMIGLTLAGETNFYCGGGAIGVTLRGSAIGAIAPTNSMTTKRTWHFKTAKAKQSPGAFEGGLPHSFEFVINGEHEVENVTLWDEFTTTEKVEINTVF